MYKLCRIVYVTVLHIINRQHRINHSGRICVLSVQPSLIIIGIPDFTGPFLQPAAPSGWICGCLICQLFLPVWCHLSVVEGVLCNLHITNTYPAFSSLHNCYYCLFTDFEHNLKGTESLQLFSKNRQSEKKLQMCR